MSDDSARIRALHRERVRLLLERNRDPLTAAQKQALQQLARSFANLARRIIAANEKGPPTKMIQ